MNSAVRSIHNLLSSGAVTVTAGQPRILKQKVGGGGGVASSTTNTLQQASTANVANGNRCYVCDDAISGTPQHILTEMTTSHTSTKFPNKIGQLVGDAFMVIVSVEDVLCSRCTNLINYLDRLENDVERVRNNLMNMLHKKYGLNDDGGGGGVSPPIKMQKMNSGLASRSSDEIGSVDMNRARKLLQSEGTTLGKQSPPVSAVQQIKISTQPTAVGAQHSTAGTQTLQRKTTRIYKCLSCDYKTSDMRLFNTHYETCKQQNFQCKNCKKIFPNFGTMKAHMVREHNTAMDNTCAVCHINFVNEGALRKHMELNHSTNVVVTSTTTLPAGATVAAATVVNTEASLPTANSVGTPVTKATTTTALYSCNHCQFKSTDKALFDEHLRKHIQGNKSKPFKCRLCAQRFETREAATIHAKQHQPNYFKCGTCTMSFPKREMLVKHFEVHQHHAGTATTAGQQQQHQVVAQPTPAPKQQAASQNILTTQKLLQETINEALSESGGSGTTTTADVAAAAANNIRFFSCHICSLTFIQENYYNQHMETHRREKKPSSSSATATTASHSNNVGSLAALNSAAQLLGDGIDDSKDTSSTAILPGQEHHQQSSQNSISEADIESIFEKMHSDKSDSTAATTSTTTAATAAGAGAGDNLVITSQEGTGGITFNITIPPQDGSDQSETTRRTSTTSAPVNVSIDMPMLDQPDEASPGNDVHEGDSNRSIKKTAPTAGPVSMPSLDDDNDAGHDTCPQAPQDEQLGAEQTQAQSSEVTTKDKETTDSKDEASAEAQQEQSKGEQSSTDSKDPAAAQEGDTKAAIEAGEAASSATEESTTPAAANEQQDETADGDVAAADVDVGADQHEAGEGEQHVAMELDEAMQAQVESGQIKFILNENGQILQLDNHIITDAEGNQILVQDPEQIQQLLQSVGVLQSGDGLDGETLQMMTDANGQMVLVQGENNETQLIDASLLGAEGHQLVIQQGQDGELGEGAHVIGEDGTRIPVSVSYTEDGQPIVQVQQQVLDAAESGEKHEGDVDESSQQQMDAANEAGGAAATTSSGGGFFALEDLMQQSSAEAKTASE